MRPEGAGFLCPPGGFFTPVKRGFLARGTRDSEPLVAPDGVRFLCTSADVRGVLSHSRERTKGRPVAANPRQHHGCPRTPRRLGWGRNLMSREAMRFLAGAAWSGFRCCACCPLAAGRHRGAALVGRGVVGLSSATRLVGWLGGTGQEWRGSPQRCMAGGAGVASVGLRRRSPPTAPARGRASMGEAGRPWGAPPERDQQKILPRRGRCHGSCRDG